MNAVSLEGRKLYFILQHLIIQFSGICGAIPPLPHTSAWFGA
jgi:hypothetical protein